MLAETPRGQPLRPTPERSDPAADRQEAIAATDPQHAFVVNARCLLWGDDTTAIADRLAGTLTDLSGPYYTIETTTSDDVHRIADAIRDHTVYPPQDDTLPAKLPWTRNRSRGIVADATVAPAFGRVDGIALTQRDSAGS